MVQFIDGVLDGIPKDGNTSVITGACVGVDAYVARAARARGLYVHTVVPWDQSRVDPEWERYCDSATHMAEGTSYKDRNQTIVDLSTELVGVPAYGEGHGKSRRSGTWQTIRLALKANKPVDVLNQEGVV
jgi:hypothetical protein